MIRETTSVKDYKQREDFKKVTVWISNIFLCQIDALIFDNKGDDSIMSSRYFIV